MKTKTGVGRCCCPTNPCIVGQDKFDGTTLKENWTDTSTPEPTPSGGKLILNDIDQEYVVWDEDLFGIEDGVYIRVRIRFTEPFDNGTTYFTGQFAAIMTDWTAEGEYIGARLTMNIFGEVFLLLTDARNGVPLTSPEKLPGVNENDEVTVSVCLYKDEEDVWHLKAMANEIKVYAQLESAPTTLRSGLQAAGSPSDDSGIWEFDDWTLHKINSECPCPVPSSSSIEGCCPCDIFLTPKIYATRLYCTVKVIDEGLGTPCDSCSPGGTPGGIILEDYDLGLGRDIIGGSPPIFLGRGWYTDPVPIPGTIPQEYEFLWQCTSRPPVGSGIISLFHDCRTNPLESEICGLFTIQAGHRGETLIYMANSLTSVPGDGTFTILSCNPYHAKATVRREYDPSVGSHNLLAFCYDPPPRAYTHVLIEVEIYE